MTKSRNLISKQGVRQAWVDANQGCHFCSCGCGNPIPLVKVHFNKGVPRFIHGHSSKLRGRAPLPERIECACGCGELAKPKNRYVNGHNGRGIPRPDSVKEAASKSKRGDLNPRWGKRPANYRGRTMHDGYVLLHVPSHPFAIKNKGTVFEHRLVLEQHLRTADPTNNHLCEVDGELYLRRDVEVHHLNQVKDDNRVENLRSMTKADHAAHHMDERGGGSEMRSHRTHY